MQDCRALAFPAENNAVEMAQTKDGLSSQWIKEKTQSEKSHALRPGGRTRRVSKDSVLLEKTVSLRDVFVDGRLREIDTSYRAPDADEANLAEHIVLDPSQPQTEYLPLRVMPAKVCNVKLELPAQPKSKIQPKQRQRSMSAASRASAKSDANVASTKNAHAQAHHRRSLEATEMLREIDLKDALLKDAPSQQSAELAIAESGMSQTPVSLVCHHNAASQKSELVLNNIPMDRAGFYMNSTYQKEYNGGDKLVPD